MFAVQLKYFTQAGILQQIGSVRLAKFFDGFTDGLRAANVVLPTPPDPLYAAALENEKYFNSMAAMLAAPAPLSERLATALLTLEEAASPENRQRLQDAIFRRIPRVGVNPQCPLDCALE